MLHKQNRLSTWQIYLQMVHGCLIPKELLRSLVSECQLHINAIYQKLFDDLEGVCVLPKKKKTASVNSKHEKFHMHFNVTISHAF